MDAETRKTLEAIAATTEQMGALGLEQPPRDAAAIRAALREVDALQSEVAWQGGALDTALAMLSGDSTREDVIEFLRRERGTDRTPTANDLRAQVDALTQQVADLEARVARQEKA